MKFSLLMSLYFKESPSYLNQALSSVWIDQTVRPSEIILVIDGPITKELQKIVNKWEILISDKLVIVNLCENIGLGKALNKGLEHCSNEWVFRMDTDDICKPNRFEKQIQFIQSYPNVALFGGQIIEFNKDIEDSSGMKTVPISNNEIKKFAKKRCPFNHMTVAYKKSVIQELGGYQHHLFMEDYNLWLRVIGKGYEVANLSEVILYARVGNGMHARRKGIEYIKSEKQLLNLKKELGLQNPIHANILFLIRSAFRLMPSSLLGTIYNTFLRKKVEK